jgi:hypothetical protein
MGPGYPAKRTKAENPREIAGVHATTPQAPNGTEQPVHDDTYTAGDQAKLGQYQQEDSIVFYDGFPWRVKDSFPNKYVLSHSTDTKGATPQNQKLLARLQER